MHVMHADTSFFLSRRFSYGAGVDGNSVLDVIRGLSLLTLYSAVRGFPQYSSFPSSPKKIKEGNKYKAKFI